MGLAGDLDLGVAASWDVGWGDAAADDGDDCATVRLIFRLHRGQKDRRIFTG